MRAGASAPANTTGQRSDDDGRRQAPPTSTEARDAFVHAGVDFLLGKSPPKHATTTAAQATRAARAAAKRAKVSSSRSVRPDPRDLGLRLVADWNERSHAAPLFHFPDRLSLLAAVAAEGFRLVTGEMHRANELSSSRRGVQLLREVALAYVRWAGREPALFSTMYDPGFAGPVEILMRATGATQVTSFQAFFGGDERATARRLQAFRELLEAKQDTLRVLLEAIRVGRADGSVRDDVSDVSLAQSVAALMDGLAWQRVTEPQGSDELLDQFAEESLELMSEGIGRGRR